MGLLHFSPRTSLYREVTSSVMISITGSLLDLQVTCYLPISVTLYMYVSEKVKIESTPCAFF